MDSMMKLFIGVTPAIGQIKAERFTEWIGEDVARWTAVAKAINVQPVQ